MASLKDIAIRDMQSVDLRQILQIERNAQVMPWSRLSFEESLSEKYRCRVVALRQPIEGKIKLAAFHVLCPIVDELHILNLAVAPDMQGQGLGHVLMDDILAIADDQEMRKIFLEVRASNSAAYSLYQKWQFKQISIRKDYYRTQAIEREDALVMVRAK
ncbi:MAG: ribosomal-protein-alanine N-acetyltransferase [Arenicella sp.]